ncbi:MAG: SRPBCC domain-containing protein [Bacteriovorax sp.]|nr:SRPBCC domain-containing protein [Bacteriovorax sp.]
METTIKNDPTLKPEINLEKSPIVKVTRIFDAPIDFVWKAWSNEELMKQWWGPEGHTCPNAKIDFREGGKYVSAIKDLAGKVVWSSGIYKEIETYKKIVCTDHFSDENGNPILASDVGMAGDWPEDLLITIEFSNTHSGQTKMIIEHVGIPKEMHDKCEESWNSSINKLQKLVERH